MDRIEKFLRGLDAKLAARVLRAIEAIAKNDLKDLDITKMKGHKDILRCRVGSVRIIFMPQSSGKNIILEVGFRGDVYKRLR